MPVYEYKCTSCRKHFDVEQSFSEDSLTTLEGCKRHKSGDHQLKKVFGSVGISFKGDGFYKNDSRPSAKKSTTNGSSTESASTDSDSSKSSSDTASGGDKTSGSDSSSKSDSKPPSGSSSAKGESKPKAKKA